MAGATTSDHATLERALGLPEALTIGMGTMIGAGIFVFPGLAVGHAGPAAALSFALGAGIAVLVALPTSELATAMPRSGGGYYFVSRGLGAAAGSLVGLGQWLGLIFASAFYLAGFGFYVNDILVRFGLGPGLPPYWFAFLAAILLTGVAIVGTRTSGDLQNWIVGILLVVLSAFLGYGLLRVAGFVEGAAAGLPDRFAPFGALPVVTTAALVFTSYLGFVQIANVAGEVREPNRTLPRAMVGSVLIVGALYVLTILVSVSVVGTGALADAGETALADVGRALLGGAGGLVVSGAGLLATLSSANASILSASRAVFALSRDDVLPAGVGRVSQRFRTPHIALLLTGAPIALLALLGRIEVLAEVASVLHLILYGLICVALLALRSDRPFWYRPSFRVPGHPVVPALGAVFSFGLVAFMRAESLLLSLGVLTAAGAWYLAFARDVEVGAPEELAPAPLGRTASILVQIEVPDAPGLPDELLEALASQRVVLLGWCEVPEQATPEQVQDELGEEAEGDLEAVADRLRARDVEVETDLVFTGDLVQTIDRTMQERDVDAVLSLRPRKQLRRILVTVQTRAMLDPLARFAAWLARTASADVLVLHPETDEDDEAEPLRDAVRSRCARFGLDDAELQAMTPEEQDSASVVLEAAHDADLVLCGETEPGEPGSLFGGINEEIARKAEVPVLIVRRSGQPAEE